MNKLLVGSILVLLSSNSYSNVESAYDATKLTYQIEKIESADRITSKFKLKDIKYNGLKLSEDLTHSTAEFICNNQLNGSSISVLSETRYAKKNTEVVGIDLDDRKFYQVPEIYKTISDDYTLTIDSITCAIRVYKDLDMFQLR